MSAEMQIAIDVLREAARDLRVRADEQRDGDIANTMREAAIIVDDAATDAANCVDFKAWLAAGCP